MRANSPASVLACLARSAYTRRTIAGSKNIRKLGEMSPLKLLETSSPAVVLPQQALENAVHNRQTAPLTNPPARSARTPPSTSGNSSAKHCGVAALRDPTPLEEETHGSVARAAFAQWDVILCPVLVNNGRVCAQLCHFGLPAVVVVRDEIAEPRFVEFLTRPYRFAYKAGK